jgi:hypothetical protein
MQRQSQSVLVLLVWFSAVLLVVGAAFTDWEWTKYRGWMGCGLLVWGTYYWNCRLRGQRAFIGPMSVDKDTPRNESLPTDVAALVVVIGGASLALNLFGIEKH